MHKKPRGAALLPRGRMTVSFCRRISLAAHCSGAAMGNGFVPAVFFARQHGLRVFFRSCRLFFARRIALTAFSCYNRDTAETARARAEFEPTLPRALRPGGPEPLEKGTVFLYAYAI